MRTSVVAIALVAVGLLSVSGFGFASSMHPGTFRETSAGVSLVQPLGILSIRSSHNFSGYVVVDARSVSSVHADWNVPKVQGSCPATKSEGSFDGISLGTGYIRTTSLFVGSETYCYLGIAHYAGYYSIGSSAFVTSFSVYAGDHMRATLHYSKAALSGSIQIQDLTRGTSNSNTFTGSLPRQVNVLWGDYASYSSTTRKILPLVDFGKVAFRNCTAALNGTRVHDLGHYSDTAVEMYDKANTAFKASVSPLTSSNTGFTIKWGSTGP